MLLLPRLKIGRSGWPFFRQPRALPARGRRSALARMGVTAATSPWSSNFGIFRSNCRSCVKSWSPTTAASERWKHGAPARGFWILTAQMEAWKGKLQQGQAHPLGPSRLTVGATICSTVQIGRPAALLSVFFMTKWIPWKKCIAACSLQFPNPSRTGEFC